MNRIRLVALLALFLSSCDDGPAEPEPVVEVEEQGLAFLHFAADVLPRVQREGSFWAVKGDDRALVLRYLDTGESTGDDDEDDAEFLTFEVSEDALFRRPDGRLFAEGDSVLITVRVSEDGRFLFEFEPSGLVFDPDEPAELEIRYLRAERDLDDDGDEDEDDEELESELSIWKQERAGLPWRLIGTVHLEESDEVEADIESFTGFAIATRHAR